MQWGIIPEQDREIYRCGIHIVDAISVAIVIVVAAVIAVAVVIIFFAQLFIAYAAISYITLHLYAYEYGPRSQWLPYARRRTYNLINEITIFFISPPFCQLCHFQFENLYSGVLLMI